MSDSARPPPALATTCLSRSTVNGSTARRRFSPGGRTLRQRSKPRRTHAGPAVTQAPEPPPLDTSRLLETLNSHGVEYLIVGGVAAIAHGAQRPTNDVDCVARRTPANLDRVAAALRELNARLHVEGLSDQEAADLPV